MNIDNVTFLVMCPECGTHHEIETDSFDINKPLKTVAMHASERAGWCEDKGICPECKAAAEKAERERRIREYNSR